MDISLTTFVDFVNSTGVKKRDIVFKNLFKGEYDPRKDFYRILRNAIVTMHKNDDPSSKLPQLVLTFDKKKTKHYNLLIKGYQKWASRKIISYIKDDSRIITLNQLDIKANPELILNIKNQPTVEKLYFKDTPLTIDASNMIVTLLSLAFGETDEYKNYQFAILDIRNSKLFKLTKKTKVDKIIETLEVEAEFWQKYQEKMKQ